VLEVRFSPKEIKFFEIIFNHDHAVLLAVAELLVLHCSDWERSFLIVPDWDFCIIHRHDTIRSASTETFRVISAFRLAKISQIVTEHGNVLQSPHFHFMSARRETIKNVDHQSIVDSSALRLFLPRISLNLWTINRFTTSFAADSNPQADSSTQSTRHSWQIYSL